MLIEKALRKAKKQSENKDEQTVQRPAFADTGPGSAEVVPRTTGRQIPIISYRNLTLLKT